MSVRRVLFATDFSNASRAAQVKAVEIARENRAVLFVAHVMSPPVLFGISPGPRAYHELEAIMRMAANDQLGAVVVAAKKARVKARGILAEGIPYERILRIAKREKVDLVVMGTHGRHGLPKVFLGSVAARVVLHARCPVLTVRGK